MATLADRIDEAASSPGELTREAGERLLDRQARAYLEMSGEAFRAAWEAGEFEHDSRSEVTRVAMLLPLLGG